MISLLLFGLTVAFGQKTRTYSGKVSNENGVAITGALISGDEGKTQVLSNENGEFTIQVSTGDKLLVEAKGMDSKLIDVKEISNIMLVQPAILAGQKNILNVPFNTIEKRLTTGAITQINIDDEMEFDQRQSIYSALDGKVSGMFGAYNIWGRGDAIVVIDGIVRTASDYNLNEIESVTVLKDPVSRMMFGAQADQGVILVKTKRGEANKRILKFRAETGINSPKALPSFLGSKDYMAAYNQALINDGAVAKYSPDDIAAAGSNPLYPNEDFYSDTYLKNSTSYFNLNGTASGGNDATQYFVNMGWSNNGGWYNLADKDVQNILNLRGNVDFKVSNNITMKMDGVAILDYKTTSNINNFWGQASSVVPNAYPTLWNPSFITSDATRDEILGKANLVNGQLLGGNKSYPKNIYGDFIFGGNRTELNRILQFNTGLDWDLSSITHGLKATGYLTFDFLNSLATYQDSKYAVYNPLENADGSVGVEVIGEDKSTGNYTTETPSAVFKRRVGMYGTLNYDKKVDEHDISLVGLIYRDQVTMKDTLQAIKNLHFGVTANYAYKGKYLADVAAVVVGSQKLPQGDNFAFTPAIGLGWILSEEDFMANNNTIDFLKLRANFGILKNDNWNNYFLYETAYQPGSNFFYDNRNASNEELNYASRASNIGWQGRQEFVFGADAAMLNKSIWVEASYFNSKSVDLITVMQYTYPTLMGGTPFYSNNNSNQDQGLDLGISYTKSSNDWSMTVGSNLVYSVPKVLNIEEPMYDDAHSYLRKEGTASDAIWGLQADGLYAESDFAVVDYVNQDFQVKDGIPVSSYGKVQPGDIKYIDKDGNGKIDNEDISEIGNNSARMQYSLYLKLQIKKFELYALGIGRVSDYNMRSNNYYRFYGELKYPELAKQAYGPTNQNVNAEYPRLSSTKNSNNFRNSTFWMYENNWFKIPTLQLSYHITSNNVGGIVKDARIFVRAADLLTISKNKDITELNFDSAPQTRSFSIGFVTKF